MVTLLYTHVIFYRDTQNGMADSAAEREARHLGYTA